MFGLQSQVKVINTTNTSQPRRTGQTQKRAQIAHISSCVSRALRGQFPYPLAGWLASRSPGPRSTPFSTPELWGREKK